jgi:hypothetical protein
MTPDTAPGLRLAAATLLEEADRAVIEQPTCKARPLALVDMAATLAGMARRAEALAARPDLLAAE